ncbi:PAS domain-containing sensor histidine kinase [Rhodospirillales bacterium]|nr:PAS domain-containing sensor histidine kinase [Rhodospirillales bacterium]
MREVGSDTDEFGEDADASEKFREYADSDWFWEIDSNFKFTLISKRFDGRSKIRENDLLGLTPWEYADANPITDPVWANLLDKLNRREPFRQLRVCIQNDDAPIFWCISGRPLVGSDGRFLGYRGAAIDETVAELRQSSFEPLLGDNEDLTSFSKDAENFKNIVTGSPQGFFIHVDGRIVFANKAAADMFGCPYAEFIGTDILDYAVPEEVPRLSEFAHARLHGDDAPEKYQFMGRRRDGIPLRVEFLVRMGEWKGQRAFHVFAQDRTSEHQALRALSESERRFRDLVEGSIQGYFVHSDWKIIYANSAAAGIFGYDPAEFIGLDLRQLIAPEERDAISSLRDRRLAGDVDAPERYEVGGVRKDGAALVFETFSRLVDWDGKPAIQATILDVTERKNIETYLMYAKETAERADRAKTEFLGNMSHEFRTPLNAIIGFSQMIKDQMMGEALPQYVEYAGAINSSGVHLLDVVNDLLDVASIESGTLTISEEIVDLVDACKACERMLRHRAHKSQVIVSLQVPDKPIRFKGDLRRLKQILINLVGNAIKFTDPDGRVTLSAEVDEKGRARLVVTDTGIGIPKEHLSHIFNPFYRVDTHYISQREGTGLGLPLVKTLADLHGAAIEIESEPGVGTRMFVIFPPQRTVDPES